MCCPISMKIQITDASTKGFGNTLLLKFTMMTKQWDEAEKIGRELTKPEYGYKLVDDYNSLFSLSGEKNSEVIFSCVR